MQQSASPISEQNNRAPVATSALQSLGRRLWKDRMIYLFLLPTIVLYSMFTLWPIIASFYMSLLDWNGFSKSAEFIGLANYTEVIHDPLFWSAFENTLVFMVITVPIRVTLALIAALVLNDKRLPLANFFRTGLFLPVVTTIAIVGIVMRFIFDPAGGPVNLFLVQLGLVSRPISFLGRSATALYTAMGIHIWKWFGVTLIYWLAALQTVPDEQYEAAQVDGANAWHRFRYITVPLLIPFAIVIFVITAIDTLRVFDLILTLTGGGPYLSTEVMEVFIYRWAFDTSVPRLGYASAAAVFFGLTTLVFAIIQAVGVGFSRKLRENK